MMKPELLCCAPMRTLKTFAITSFITLSLAAFVFSSITVSQNRPAAPATPRLYIFDCGTIGSMNPASYMSHYHSDHTANANEFAGSTWIVQETERAAMFGERAPAMAQRANFSKLEGAKTIVAANKDHDVFGDGSVVIKFTPGHTPGHQSLFLRLARTGPVVLAGDLYHYPEERTLDRIPTFEADRELTRKSRIALEQFLKQSGAQLWIQHDPALHQGLAKSPKFID
jgi:glyoxylase-like metal-dependent hydrolase (beta-lactamase superfamily II)